MDTELDPSKLSPENLKAHRDGLRFQSRHRETRLAARRWMKKNMEAVRKGGPTWPLRESIERDIRSVANGELFNTQEKIDKELKRRLTIIADTRRELARQGGVTQTKPDGAKLSPRQAKRAKQRAKQERRRVWEQQLPHERQQAMEQKKIKRQEELRVKAERAEQKERVTAEREKLRQQVMEQLRPPS